MEKNKSHFLSLIIPSYKNEKTIVENIKKIKSVLDYIRYDYEIIVIVDGFIDKSFNVLKKAKLKKTKIIGYKDNQGKSFAIRLGMSHAIGDYIMFIDSGSEIDLNGIPMLLEHMEWYGADIIVGSKRHLASQVNYARSRKILSDGYYFLVKFLFGIKVKDTQAGIKIFKKKVIEKILPRLVEKKFCGDLEILAVSHLLGFKKIYEAPIKMDYSLAFETQAATIKAIWYIFLDTMAIWYRKNILREYDKPKNKFSIPRSLKIKIFSRKN